MRLEKLIMQTAEKQKRPKENFNEYLDEKLGKGTSQKLEELLYKEINLQTQDPYNVRAHRAADSVIIFGKAKFLDPDDRQKILDSLKDKLTSDLYMGRGEYKSLRTAPFVRAYYALTGEEPDVPQRAVVRHERIKNDLGKEALRQLRRKDYVRAGEYAATCKLLFNEQIGSDEDVKKMIKTTEANTKPYVKNLGEDPYSTTAVSMGAATLRILKASQIKPVRYNKFRGIEIS